MGQSQEGNPGDNLAQLLGSLLGGVAGAGGGVSGGAAPSITVTIPGVPTFIQGLSEFIQVGIFFLWYTYKSANSIYIAFFNDWHRPIRFSVCPMLQRIS